MKDIKLITIKPQTGQVEYGVEEAGQWVIHGLVFSVALTDEATLHAIRTAAIGDATSRGYLD